MKRQFKSTLQIRLVQVLLFFSLAIGLLISAPSYSAPSDRVSHYSASEFTSLRLGPDSISEINLQDWLYYHSSENIEDLPTLLAQPANRWRKLPQHPAHKIGINHYWLAFQIYSPSDYLSRILAIDNPLIDSIKLYHLVDGEMVQYEHMGDALPFTQRPLQSNTFMFPFDLKPNQTHTFYIKVDTQGSINLPMVLWSSSDLSQYTETKYLVQGFQIGLLFAIALFSLFIALASGSYSYSYYFGYVVGVAILICTLYGMSFRYLWPEYPQLQKYVIVIIIPFIMGFYFMFTEKVLQLKYHHLTMLQGCRMMAAISFSLCFITPFINYVAALYALFIYVVLASSILVLFSVSQAVKGMRNASLYSLGRIGLLLGCVVSGLIYFGMLPLQWRLQSPVMLGLTFEVITMSAVLAIRYNDERKDKLRIQQQALEQAQRIKESREEAIKVKAESNAKLENMVQERTLELEITLRELNEVNQKLTEQNTIDSLTGVKNRSEFDRRLLAEGRISRRQQTPLGILMVDIDKFKSINDEFGHLAGDSTIQEIARTLTAHLKRPTDLLSRFGGEEFAIILPNTTDEGAMMVAEQMRNAVSKLAVFWHDQKIQLTISIGVSVAVIESDSHPQTLLDQADKALYQAKRTGRNKVCLFEHDND